MGLPAPVKIRIFCFLPWEHQTVHTCTLLEIAGKLGEMLKRPWKAGITGEEGRNEVSSMVAQMVKSLPEMQETRVSYLGQEDPLEKEIATYSSVLAWRIPWQRSLAGYSPWGCKASDTTEQLTLSFLFLFSFSAWKVKSKLAKRRETQAEPSNLTELESQMEICRGQDNQNWQDRASRQRESRWRALHGVPRVFG